MKDISIPSFGPTTYINHPRYDSVARFIEGLEEIRLWKEAIDPQPILQEILHKMEPTATSFAASSVVDYSDSLDQLHVVQEHYKNRNDNDYVEGSVVYELMDGVPRSYHGKDGARVLLKDIPLPIEIQHINVKLNHAQVVWKAKSSTHGTIVGTDSFTFDKDNHILLQSTVALTER